MKQPSVLIKLLGALPAFLYGQMVSFRNKLYDSGLLKSHTMPFPLISVGNLSVGGTGKTPMVEYLIRLLKNHYYVTIVSRGYGRKTSGLVEVTPRKTADIVGDEPLQIVKKFGNNIRFIVDENRRRALQFLKSQYDALSRQDHKLPFVAILDDAMQHRKIVAGLLIVLMDYDNLPFNDYYLPLGRLRDNPEQIRRADIVIITKSPQNIDQTTRHAIKRKLNLLAYQSLFFSTIAYQDLKPVFNTTYRRSITSIDSQYRILLVTGIAKPQPLIDELKRYTPHVEHMAFADHHRYTYDDLYRISKRMKYLRTPKKLLITTEKDVERLLAAEGRELIEELPVYYLPVNMQFLTHEEQEKFEQIIIDYVSKNKTIGRIY